MKKFLSVLLSASILVATTTSFAAVESFASNDEFTRAEVTDYGFVIDKEGIIRLEAEDVDVSHHVISSSNPSKIVERADASNGKFLAAATGLVEDDRYFEFKFTLNMDAKIVMSAAYAQTEKWKNQPENMADSYVYMIDNNKRVGLSSNYVLQARDDITKWDTVTYDEFTLPKGEHTVRVRVAKYTDKGNPNIDYIDFDVKEVKGGLPKDEFTRAEVTDYGFVIDKEGVTRLEAEDVDVTHYVISDSNPSKIVERADASNGKFLAAATGILGSDRYFEFKFTLNMNAKIVMSAAYAQTEKWKKQAESMVDSYTYMIDKTKKVGLSSNYVLQPRDDITIWDTVTYDEIILPKGEHTVRVRVAKDTGKGQPNIDYIDFNVTEFTGDLPVDDNAVKDNDIHTELQYAYLNDPNIANVHSYASGGEDLSRPKAIVCDFSKDERIGTSDTYIIQKSATEDFSDPITITGLKEKSYGFYNLMLGEHFYWRGGTSLDTIKNSPVHEMTINDQGPRNCYVDGATNVRDIGGYSSSLVEGGMIRQGLYYRGANIDWLSAKGKAQLKDELGVKAEIDLRDSDQCKGPYVDGVEYNPIPIPSYTESTHFEKFANEFRQIYAVIANADEKPVYLHCLAGADRTGISSFMLLMVLGVSFEDAARDYLFTNFSTWGARYINVPEEWNRKLARFDGDTTAEKAKNWMISKGIPEVQIEKIREIFVTGYTAKVTGEVYEISDDSKHDWTQESEEDLVFIVNADLNKLVEVKVDGNVVDKAQYAVDSGAKTVALSSEYLNTLERGEHVLTISFNDGVAATTFKVLLLNYAPLPDTTDTPNTGDTTNTGDAQNTGDTTNTPDSPPTGEESHIIWIVLILISSAVVILGTVCSSRMRKLHK